MVPVSSFSWQTVDGRRQTATFGFTSPTSSPSPPFSGDSSPLVLWQSSSRPLTKRGLRDRIQKCSEKDLFSPLAPFNHMNILESLLSHLSFSPLSSCKQPATVRSSYVPCREGMQGVVGCFQELNSGVYHDYVLSLS